MKETITVRRNNGTLEAVAADVNEAFGIHESLSGIAGSFTVTHLYTGNALKNSLSRAQADELVKRLIATPIDWSFTDRDVAQSLGDMVIPLIRAVMAEVK